LSRRRSGEGGNEIGGNVTAGLRLGSGGRVILVFVCLGLISRLSGTGKRGTIRIGKRRANGSTEAFRATHHDARSGERQPRRVTLTI
jgi:hypothetical protein